MELQKNNTSQENGMDHTSYLPEASLRRGGDIFYCQT